MRGTPASLVGLALFFGLANAQSAYDNTCNPRPVGDQDVEPGIVATYDCGTWYHSGHYAGSSVTAATPEVCASECAKRSPEGPCTWYGNTCYYYNAGAPTVTAIAPDLEAIAIKTRKDWDKLKADFNKCQADKAVVDGELTTCKADQGTGGGGGGAGIPGGGSGGSAGSPISLGAAACPGSNYALISHRGQNWKLLCRKTVSGTDRTGTSSSAKTRDQCVDACANNSQCKWSHWNGVTRGCYTYTSSRIPEDFTVTSDWNVYVKV